MKERYKYNGENYYVIHDEKNKIGKIVNDDYKIINEDSEEYKQVSIQFKKFHKLAE